MDKEEIAKRLRQVDEQKKVDTYLHQVENEQPIKNEGLPINPKEIIPKSAINAPSHHDKMVFHKDRHRPPESVIKELKEKQSSKEFEILEPWQTK